MKGFALFLTSINDYEEAIEEFERYGYEIDKKWNEYVLSEKWITWNHDSYLLFDSTVQLHNHDGEFPVFINIKDLNLHKH